MSKRIAAITIAVILIVLAVGLTAFYFFYYRPNYMPSDSTSEQKGIFGTLFGTAEDKAPAADTAPDTQTDTTETEGDTAGVPITVATKKYRKITGSAIAGSYIADVVVETIKDNKKQRETKTIIRYQERGNGHIYEIDASSTVPVKVSNTTIPKVYETLFSNKGNSVIMRYLNDNEEIVTYSATLKKQATTSPELYEIDGVYLPKNIDEITVSPDETKIAYHEKGSGSVITANLSGSGKVAVYSSAVTEWLLGWPEASSLVLTVKPTYLDNSFAYTLPSKGGLLSKISGGQLGLNVLVNKVKTYMIVSRSTGSSIAASVTNLKDKSSNDIGATLADKCVWSKKNPLIAYCAVPTFVPPGKYPDSWYQGRVTFSDVVRRIDATSGASTVAFDPVKSGVGEIDGINLIVNGSDTTLLLTNKRDYSLWSVNLE